MMTPTRIIKKSDLFFETRVQNAATDFGYSALISEETNKITSSSLRLNQALTDDVEFTSIFRHQREKESQWGNALSVRFGNNWMSKLQVIRTKDRADDPDSLIETSLSLDYESCCTRVGVMLSRDKELDGSYDNSISLIFDLLFRR